MAEDEKKTGEEKEIPYVQEDPGPIGQVIAERQAKLTEKQIEVTQLVARRSRTVSILVGFATVFITLAIGGATLYQTITDSNNAEEARGVDREIAHDQQLEDALQTYFDKMGELLLKEGLGAVAPKNEVLHIARTRTLTVLRALDPDRKNLIMQFLIDAELVKVINLSGVNLSGVNLSEVNLSGVNLSGADLSRANLGGANLEGANLEGANLEEADLEEAYLSRADLSRANLREANLGGANLEGANLSRANLEQANLFGAYLFGADLSRANLREANLGGASLEEADLFGANLGGAKYDDLTTRPDDFDLQEAGADEKPESGIFPGLVEVFGEEKSTNGKPGFVISERGYVITYQIKGTQKVYVRLSGQDQKLPATVVERSPDTFLTLLKLPQGSYRYLEQAYAELDDIVSKVNIRSGTIARGRVTSIQGTVRFNVSPDEDVIVTGVEIVQPALSQADEYAGGAPVLNWQRKVVGVLIARGPSYSIMIPASRIQDVFPIITR
jgi:uncharacterized protein YjbI with pentapeptide repeats